MPTFKLHDQLSADSALIVAVEVLEIRLIKQAAVPWLIIVPYTEAQEWDHLSWSLRMEILRYQDQISKHLRAEYSAQKINTALIGNVVSQMHIHVIGRRHDDEFWPAPLWGKPFRAYTTPALQIEVDRWRLLLGDL